MHRPKRHLYIISGSSRGLGLALARALLASQDHQVVGIARRDNESLYNLAAATGSALQQWRQDLAQPLPVAQALKQWLQAQPLAQFETLTLINNAGMVTHPGAVQDTALAELSDALRVGAEATLLLSAAFLDACRQVPGELRVLNISSGLGRRAMAGTAAYCAAKAAMDHLSRAMALDEAHRAGQGLKAARIVSLAPGVVDTDMQLQLRSATPAAFPEQPRFEALKTDQQLSSPEQTATAVLRYLARADFGEQVIADVREA
ncbi:MAG TPA: SDR family NAD(P)-dependent oxidoreductase [Burkholderiaceae bacterium]|nr:SDR family NAD(P)-dependent oxidoreductase [Burkholderiaceae bacterium]